VGTSGNAGSATLTAAWRCQGGRSSGQRAGRSTAKNTAFHLSWPTGLKAGAYKVVLLLGDDSADTKVFVRKK